MTCITKPASKIASKNTDQQLIDSDRQFYMSKESLAQALAVSPRTITAWRYRYKNFPALKIGRHVRYKMAEVLQWQRDTFA